MVTTSNEITSSSSSLSSSWQAAVNTTIQHFYDEIAQNKTINEGALNNTIGGGGGKAKELDDEFYKNVFTVICYSLIILVSLCGNTLVLKVILSRKKLHTTTNMLIAMLACSDVLTTTLNM